MNAPFVIMMSKAALIIWHAAPSSIRHSCRLAYLKMHSAVDMNQSHGITFQYTYMLNEELKPTTMMPKVAVIAAFPAVLSAFCGMKENGLGTSTCIENTRTTL